MGMVKGHFRALTTALLSALLGIAFSFSAPPAKAEPLSAASAAQLNSRAVEKLMEESRFKDAAELARKIRLKADAEKDERTSARALSAEFQAMISLESIETAAEMLQSVSVPQNSEARVRVQLLRVSSLLRYLDRYGWRIRQRERTESLSGHKPIEKWTRREIIHGIIAAFADIWSIRGELADMPFSSFSDLLERNDFPPTVRPTLRDAVTYLWIEQLASRFMWLSEMQSAVFEVPPDVLLDAPEGSADDTERLLDRAVHPLAKISMLLSDLERFHRDAQRREAELETRRMRLETFFPLVTESQKRILTDDFIQRIKAFEKESWWSMAAASLAEKLIQAAGNSDSLAEILALAKSGQNAFPESAGGKRCAEIAEHIEGTELHVQMSSQDGPRKRSILVSHRNVREVFFRAYPFDLLAFASQGHRVHEEFQKKIEELVTTKKPAAAWSVSLTDLGDYRNHQTFVTPPLDNPGTYLIVASMDESFDRRRVSLEGLPFNVSGIAMTSSETGDGRQEIRVLDADTGAPIKGAKVLIRQGAERWDAPLVNAGQGVTDESGLVTMDVGGGKQARKWFAMALHGKDVAFDQNINWIWERSSPCMVSSEAAIYTDRAIYRPGQTVQWKVVPYRADRQTLKFSTMPKTQVTVVMRDASGEKIQTAKVYTNAFGSAFGEFVIPDDRALGLWRLNVSLGETQNSDNPEGSHSFNVEEYKRPTFDVALERPEGAAMFNSPLTVKGTARALSGFTLSGGKVSWSVVRTPRVIWRPWENEWRSSFRYMRSHSSAVAAGGMTQVGKDGRFSFNFIPRIDPADEELFPNDVWNYQVQVSVTDEGGETRSASIYVPVSWSPLAASIQLPEGLLIEKELKDAVLVLESRDHGGHAQRARSSWKIVRLAIPEGLMAPADIPRMIYPRLETKKDPAESRRTLPGDLMRPRWTHYSLEEALASFEDGEKVSSGQARHGEDGLAKVSLKSLSAGAYRIRAELTDPKTGKVSRVQKEFVVASASPALNLPLVLLADRNSAEVGESVRLFVHSGRPGQNLFYEVFHGKKRISSRWIKAGSDPALFDLKISPQERGGITVRISSVMDWQFMSQSLNIDVPYTDRKLLVEWLEVPETAEPGAEKAIRLKVSRADGRKLQASSTEVLGLIYDKSLDAFASRAPFSPLSLLPSRLGAPEIWITQSKTARNIFLSRRDAQKDSQSRSHRSQGAFRGDHFRNFFSGYGRGMESPRMYRASRGMPRLAGRAAAEPNVSAQGRRDFAQMAGKSAGRPMAAASDSHPRADFADFSDNSDSAEGNILSASIRRDFRETALWVPAIQPNADGSVMMTFTVPDALTSWKVWAIAMDKNLNSAVDSRTFVSARKLMVRPRLPRFLREGDSAELSVTVENALDEAVAGTIEVNITDAESGKNLSAEYGLDETAARQKFSAGPKAGTSAVFPVRVPPGIRTIRVRAEARIPGKELSDGEERELPVLPSRAHLSASRFAALRGNETRKLSFDLPSGDDTLLHESLNVTLDASLLDGILSAMPYLMETPFESVSETVDKFTAVNTLLGLYAKFPSLEMRAKTIADSRKETKAQPFENGAGKRRIALEETPWLRASRDCSSGRDCSLTAFLDPKTAAAVREKAIKSIADSQHENGGFSWWKGGEPTPYMTLYVLDGLLESAWFGGQIPGDISSRAWNYIFAWYKREILPLMKSPKEWPEVSVEFIAYLNFVASGFNAQQTLPVPSASEYFQQMLDFTLERQKNLSARGRGYLALTLNRMGRGEEAKKVFETLMSSASTTDNEGIFWQPEARSWLWYRDTVGSHAFALRVLTELSPNDSRRAGLAQWLFLNKKLDHWRSPRASAAAISALARYALSGGWGKTAERIQVTLGGQAEVRTFEQGKSAPEQRWMSLPPEKIDAAALSDIRLEQQTPGLMFASAAWHYSTEKGSETAAQGDLFSVSRAYFRRVLKNHQWTLEPLSEAASLELGDEVEVHLTLSLRHPAEFIHLRDPRAAGFEPVDGISGYRCDDGLCRQQEIRDSSTNFFIDRLPQGKVTLRYRMRASMAGDFRLAPAAIQSVYSPEFSAHSEGAVVKIGGVKK